jgi:hypothetical protein
MAEADPFEHRPRAATPLGHREPRVHQAGGDVLERGHPVQQEELLEHEPDAPRPQAGQLAVAERADVVAGHLEPAARRPVERAHDVQERGLPGARRPDDRHQLALPYPERHAAQRVHASGIGLVHRVELEDGHCAVTTRMPSRRPEPDTST